MQAIIKHKKTGQELDLSNGPVETLKGVLYSLDHTGRIWASKWNRITKKFMTTESTNWLIKPQL